MTLSCNQTFAALRPNVHLSTGNLTLCSKDGNVANVTSASHLVSIAAIRTVSQRPFLLRSPKCLILWHMIGPPYLSANQWISISRRIRWQPLLKTLSIMSWYHFQGFGIESHSRRCISRWLSNLCTMFLVNMFLTGKLWKQPKCPVLNEKLSQWSLITAGDHLVAITRRKTWSVRICKDTQTKVRCKSRTTKRMYALTPMTQKYQKYACEHCLASECESALKRIAFILKFQ